MTVQASTEHLAKIRDFVAGHAINSGFKKEDVADIRLAVDEAFTNIIKHAYKHDDNRSVDIKLGYDNDEFWVALLDSGKTFDLSSYTEPDVQEKVKQKKRGGVGVYLIKKLMDDVEYTKEGAFNKIRMIKKR